MSKKDPFDKYYTHPSVASHCVDVLRDVIPADQRQIVVEPSAGNGAFLCHFDITIAFDLVPEAPGITQQNFFDVYPFIFLDKAAITILGNPPFGKNSSLAVKFFNHAATLGNTIAFIVPKTFRKTSVQKRLNMNFHLEHDEELPKNSFLLHGKSHDVPCVFQVWQYKEEERLITYPENPYFEFIKKADAGKDTFCIARVGSKTGQVLLGLDHAERSTYFVNPKIMFCRQRMMMPWGDGTLNDIVSNTVAQKSISKHEMPIAIENSLNLFLQEKDKKA